MIRVWVFLAIAVVLVAVGWYWPLACYTCFLIGGVGGERHGRQEAARERA